MRTTILALALTAFGCAPAFAQGVYCAPRKAIISHISAKYSEAQQGIGVRNDSEVVELWVSKRGSFTVLLTGSNGVSCVVAAGKFWAEKVAVKGDPA